MKLLFCHCTQCKACRRHKRNQFHITYTKRASRSLVKRNLRLGQWELLPIAIGLGYFG